VIDAVIIATVGVAALVAVLFFEVHALGRSEGRDRTYALKLAAQRYEQTKQLIELSDGLKNLPPEEREWYRNQIKEVDQ